jgi:hypothetical protein
MALTSKRPALGGPLPVAGVGTRDLDHRAYLGDLRHVLTLSPFERSYAYDLWAATHSLRHSP